MITAIDSSVLWAIIKSEPGHEEWIDTLLMPGGMDDDPEAGPSST